jgi:hypothetical protein
MKNVHLVTSERRSLEVTYRSIFRGGWTVIAEQKGAAMRLDGEPWWQSLPHQDGENLTVRIAPLMLQKI